MLSGTVRAVLMSWVTIRNVASIWAFRSTISWLRNAVRTGSRPGPVRRTARSRGPAQARGPVRACGMPPRSHPGSLSSAPRDPRSIFFHHDVADLGLRLLGVLAQREGDVVVEVHRPEHRAVPEQHAEQLADLVEIALGAGGNVGALDQDGALVRLDQPDRVLRKTDLPRRTGRASRRSRLPGSSMTSPQMSWDCRTTW